MTQVKERRFNNEEAKFSTQHRLTFYVISIMALVTAWVLLWGSIEQRSAVVQMWIGLTLLMAGFWFATSKGSADKETQLNRMIPASTVMQANTDATNKNTAATTDNTEREEKT